MPAYLNPNDFLAASNSSTTAAKTAAATTKALKAIRDARYVESLWVTIAFVILLLAFVRACKALLTIRRVNSPFVPPIKSNSDYDLEQGSTNEYSWTRLPSAITSGFRIAAFRWSVWYGPGTTILMSEAVFVTLYVVLNLVWTFIDTSDLSITFWQGRSARIASSQIPLIVALSGRNNVISWLTGISHEKLNVLHRAAGRTALILVWAHSAQHFVNGVPTLATTPWIIMGVISTVALTLLVILSIRPIRVHLHQFFFYSHIALALLTIVTGYIHAKEFDLGAYFWPALLIWALDRVLRVVNMLLNARKSKSCSQWYSSSDTEKAQTKATIQVLGSDTVRITMKRRMNWSAGQHAYICMPSISNSPAESHPFTIASISRTMDGSPPEQEKDLIFLVRGRGGFTKKLMERAEQGGYGSTGRQAQITAFIDGPYGHPPNLNQYTTCVLIAGGSGVSYTLPLLLDLIASARLGLTQCRKILFVWAMRDPSHLTWIERVLSQALSDAPKTLVVDARVYITGSRKGVTALFGRVASVVIQKPPVSFLEVDLGEDGERRLSVAGSMFGLAGYLGGGDVPPKRPHGLSGLNPLREKEKEAETPRVRVEYKRPDVKELLEAEVLASHGTVSVDVAGPTGLTKTVRDALRGDLCSPIGVLRGRAPVVLHTETFGA